MTRFEYILTMRATKELDKGSIIFGPTSEETEATKALEQATRNFNKGLTGITEYYEFMYDYMNIKIDPLTGKPVL